MAFKGQTLGKMLFDVKVVRAESGSVPGTGKSIARWVILVFVLFVLFVGGLV